MMMDNTARVLTQTPAQEQPRTVAKPKVTATPRQRVHISPFEKVCAGVLAFAVCGMVVATLGIQASIVQTTRDFQSTQVKTSKENQKIANLEQAVSELTDSERLSAFAKAHGMTVAEDSVKQAVK